MRLSNIATIITGLAVLVGGIAWLTNINHLSRANAAKIDDIRANELFYRQRYLDELKNISKSVYELNGKMDILLTNEHR